MAPGEPSAATNLDEVRRRQAAPGGAGPATQEKRFSEVSVGSITVLAFGAVAALVFLAPVVFRSTFVTRDGSMASNQLIALAGVGGMALLASIILLCRIVVEGIRRSSNGISLLLSAACTLGVISVLSALAARVFSGGSAQWAWAHSAHRAAQSTTRTLGVLSGLLAVVVVVWVVKKARSSRRSEGRADSVRWGAAGTAFVIVAGLVVALLAITQPANTRDVAAAYTQVASAAHHYEVAQTSCPSGYPYYDARTHRCDQGPPSGQGGSASSKSSGGGGTATPNSASPSPHPNCIPTDVGANVYIRVDVTSRAPCYSHWNLSSRGGGTDCGMVTDRGTYGLPNNMWNIVTWTEYPTTGPDSLSYSVTFANGSSVDLYCAYVNRAEPQYTLIGENWG